MFIFRFGFIILIDSDDQWVNMVSCYKVFQCMVVITITSVTPHPAQVCMYVKIGLNGC